MESTQLTGSNFQGQSIKISVEIEIEGKPALCVTVQAEGDAQSVQQATVQLSTAIASLVSQVMGPQTVPITETPVSVQVAVPTPTALAVPRKPNQAVALVWLARHQQRLTIGFGGALVLAAILVAVVFPPLVPRAQRIEVFMMSLAFGLIGAGALFAGALPGKTDSPAPQPAQSPAPAVPFAPRYNSAKALLQKRKPLNAIWGLGFGALFLVAGLVAPFVLGQANADDRFLMMIGFAPVAVTGALMIAIFWRVVTGKAPTSTPSAKPAASAPRSSKPSVTRIPDQAAFKLGVPLLIGTSLVILVAVLALVVVATVLPILNR